MVGDLVRLIEAQREARALADETGVERLVIGRDGVQNVIDRRT
jgi:hypothetical protein